MASKISTNARFKLPRKDSMKKMQKNLRRGAPKIKENSLTKLRSSLTMVEKEEEIERSW